MIGGLVFGVLFIFLAYQIYIKLFEYPIGQILVYIIGFLAFICFMAYFSSLPMVLLNILLLFIIILLSLSFSSTFILPLRYDFGGECFPFHYFVCTFIGNRDDTKGGVVDIKYIIIHEKFTSF